MKKRRKRKMSAKQRAALAKGRAALARKRGKRLFGRKRRKVSRKRTSKTARKAKNIRTKRSSVNVEPIIIARGDSMSGKKRKRSKRRTYRGEFGKSRRRRRSRRYSGEMAFLGGSRINPVQIVTNVAGIAAGAVGASMVAGFVPVKDAKIKAMVPIALSVLLGTLPMTRKNKFIQIASMGALASGTIALVKQFAPQLPMLAGEETYVAVDTANGPALLEANAAAEAGIPDSAFEGVDDLDATKI